MRAVLQRVSDASVEIDKKIVGSINQGLLVLLGIEDGDGKEDIEWLVNKILSMRIFSDEMGKMNLSVNDIDGDLLIVSQFTLHASTKKGNRPSYIKAARPEIAIPLYEKFIMQMDKDIKGDVFSGIFGAYMKVSLENDGPVTIIIDTRNKE